MTVNFLLCCLWHSGMSKFVFTVHFWMTVTVTFTTFYVHLSASRYYNFVILYLAV